MGSIIYFIGLVLAILAVIDIIKKPISLVACLENRCTFARTGGSNPFLTATNCSPAL